MHGLFQSSKNSRNCTQTVRSGSFSMFGARFGAYCNLKFRDRLGCGGVLDRKKRVGLYMVVRPTLFFVGRAAYAPGPSEILKV